MAILSLSLSQCLSQSEIIIPAWVYVHVQKTNTEWAYSLILIYSFVAIKTENNVSSLPLKYAQSDNAQYHLQGNSNICNTQKNQLKSQPEK